MERLTRYIGSRAATVGHMDDLRDLRAVVDRLAAYEDTGLSPEEVALYVKCQAESVSRRELQLGREVERLYDQLAEAQRREQAAVEDFESAAHDGGIWCEFCGTDCTDADTKMCGDMWRCGRFTWRGPQEAKEA